MQHAYQWHVTNLVSGQNLNIYIYVLYKRLCDIIARLMSLFFTIRDV